MSRIFSVDSDESEINFGTYFEDSMDHILNKTYDKFEMSSCKTPIKSISFQPITETPKNKRKMTCKNLLNVIEEIESFLTPKSKRNKITKIMQQKLNEVSKMRNESYINTVPSTSSDKEFHQFIDGIKRSDNQSERKYELSKMRNEDSKDCANTIQSTPSDKELRELVDEIKRSEALECNESVSNSRERVTYSAEQMKRNRLLAVIRLRDTQSNGCNRIVSDLNCILPSLIWLLLKLFTLFYDVIDDADSFILTLSLMYFSLNFYHTF